MSTAVLAAVLLAAPALAAGMLELNPSQGAAGDEFQISGRGFEASEQVKLKWNGSPVGPPVRADADGEFTTTRTVPIDALPGSHTVTATGLQSGLSAEALLRVIDPAETTTTTSPATTTTSPATTTTSPATTTTSPASTTTAADETTTTSLNAATAANEKTTSSLNTVSPADEKTTTSLNTATNEDGLLVVGEPRMASAEATPGSPVDLEVVAADDTSTGTGLNSLDDSNLNDVLTTPIGLAGAVGMPLVVAIAVWWMWRKPTDDEKGSLE